MTGRVLYEVPPGYIRQPGDVDGSWDLLSEEDQQAMPELDPSRKLGKQGKVEPGANSPGGADPAE